MYSLSQLVPVLEALSVRSSFEHDGVEWDGREKGIHTLTQLLKTEVHPDMIPEVVLYSPNTTILRIYLLYITVALTTPPPIAVSSIGHS